MDDITFFQQFEAGTFPHENWHHREHIKAAYLYLCRYPFDVALDRMRRSIQALNAAHRLPESPGRGYHETMTQVWMRLVHLALSEYGPEDNADRFYEAHPELAEKKIIRFFYSKALLGDPRAKLEFVAPDLAPLPRPIKSPTPPLNRAIN